MEKIGAEGKKRLRRLLIHGTAWLGGGLAYYLFVRLTGWGLPCPFYLVTQKYCPGCGITRMLMSLLVGDFSAALRYNMLVFFLLPFGAVIGVRDAVCYVRTGAAKTTGKAEQILLVLALILTVTFGILRNLPAFAWMAPPA